jgi:hypothetical protein
VGLLLVLVGPIEFGAVARAGDPEQLVIQYLQDHGAQNGTYTIDPVTDPYVTNTFPDIAFFGVFFRQYPVAIRPPDGLVSSNLFYVQNNKVAYLTEPSQLMDFFFSQLGPIPTKKGIRDAGRSWLRLSEEFTQDQFYTFSKPHVSAQRNCATGMVVVKNGGTGQLIATLTFDDSGQLVDIEESRDVVRGRRPQ